MIRSLDLPSSTFCALLDGYIYETKWTYACMLYCKRICVQDKDSTNKTVSEAGVLRRDDDKLQILQRQVCSMHGITIHEVGCKMMLKGERLDSVLNALEKKMLDTEAKDSGKRLSGYMNLVLKTLLARLKKMDLYRPEVRYIDLRLG